MRLLRAKLKGDRHAESAVTDAFRDMWKSAWRRAEAGSVADAHVALAMFVGILESNGDRRYPVVRIPTWMLHDVVPALRAGIAGCDLTAAFHLKRGRGASLMTNEVRDWTISVIATFEKNLEVLADRLESEYGLPPPKSGSVWTADAIAKILATQERRKKLGLSFPSM